MEIASAIGGFQLGLSLIVAIGAQNAFVLRQGLREEHVFWICLVCATSDALLIAVGVSGFGRLSELMPWFAPAMRYGGAAFLIWYGARSALSAWRGGAALLAEDGASASRLRPALLTVLALTWLNPHVYLDTVVLLGAVALQYDDRFWFGIGAVISSFVFFFSLGYGARLLRPVFASSRAWRILDAGIALLMWSIAAALLWP